MIASYPWLALVDIRVPLDGETVMLSEGGIIVAHSFVCTYPIVKPANVYNVLRLEDAPDIPEGHEPDGSSLKDAFGEVSEFGLYLTIGGTVGRKDHGISIDPDKRRLRLRKIAPKTVRVLVVEWDITEAASREQRECIEAWLRHPGPFDTSRVEDRPL